MHEGVLYVYKTVKCFYGSNPMNLTFLL